MKDYSVLLKKDNGTQETITITAANENDARWKGKKIEGVYEAVVMKRKPGSGQHRTNGSPAIAGAGRPRLEGATHRIWVTAEERTMILKSRSENKLLIKVQNIKK